ncbi:oxaloacetate decarboxylase [Chloroflexota bacterium]
MRRTTLLRKLLAEERLIIAPGAYDAFSAKIIEKAGFKAVVVGGSSCSASLLGKPDVGLLTMTEMVQCASNIANAVDLPVLADAEAGYGSIPNIQRTVMEFEKAGVAAIYIEDQPHPVKQGIMRKLKQVIPAEEMVMKIRAAVDARSDPDFVIGARTDADIVSIEEQIRRCNLYGEAGADLVMPLVNKKAEFEHVAREVKTPLWLNLGAHRDVTAADLRGMGVTGIAAYSVDSILVAATAVLDLMTELRDKGTVRETVMKPGALLVHDFPNFLGLAEIVEREGKYVTK